ncbi:13211_t:CDS:1, partial [Ambispora leptoticha]
MSETKPPASPSPLKTFTTKIFKRKSTAEETSSPTRSSSTVSFAERPEEHEETTPDINKEHEEISAHPTETTEEHEATAPHSASIKKEQGPTIQASPSLEKQDAPTPIPPTRGEPLEMQGDVTKESEQETSVPQDDAKEVHKTDSAEPTPPAENNLPSKEISFTSGPNEEMSDTAKAEPAENVTTPQISDTPDRQTPEISRTNEDVGVAPLKEPTTKDTTVPSQVPISQSETLKAQVTPPEEPYTQVAPTPLKFVTASTEETPHSTIESIPQKPQQEQEPPSPQIPQQEQEPPSPQIPQQEQPPSPQILQQEQEPPSPQILQQEREQPKTQKKELKPPHQAAYLQSSKHNAAKERAKAALSPVSPIKEIWDKNWLLRLCTYILAAFSSIPICILGGWIIGSAMLVFGIVGIVMFVVEIVGGGIAAIIFFPIFCVLTFLAFILAVIVAVAYISYRLIAENGK